MKINRTKLSAKPLVSNKMPEQKGPATGIVDKFVSTGKKINDYTKPRFDPEKGVNTSGNMSTSSTFNAVLGGGIAALVSTGLPGVPAGALGGIVGVKVGEKTGSRFAAVAAGALTGAAAGAAAGAVIGGPVALVSSAISGAFSGATGTLYGSAKASTKDGVFGGAAVGAIVMGPAGALVGSVAGGLGGSAVDDVGRGVLGTAAGAVIGGAIGAMAGPGGIVAGALKGALIGGAGSIAGPRIRQTVRNFQQDLTAFLDKKTSPHLKNVKVKRWQKVAMGAVAGALPIAFSAGLIIGGPIAIAAGAAIGGTIGAKAIMSSSKKKGQKKEVPVKPDNPSDVSKE